MVNVCLKRKAKVTGEIFKKEGRLLTCKVWWSIWFCTFSFARKDVVGLQKMDIIADHKNGQVSTEAEYISVEPFSALEVVTGNLKWNQKCTTILFVNVIVLDVFSNVLYMLLSTGWYHCLPLLF